MPGSHDLQSVPVAALWDEISRRSEEADRVPERTLLRGIARWRHVCAAVHLGGFLRIAYSCERIPGDQVEVNETITRGNVMWLDAVMRTRDRRPSRGGKIISVRFRQVVKIVAPHKERLHEIWKLTEEAYRHEAAELLKIGSRRISRTHQNGSCDTSVQGPLDHAAR